MFQFGRKNDSACSTREKECYLRGVYSIMICLLCCVVKAAGVGGSQGVADDQT